MILHNQPDIGQFKDLTELLLLKTQFKCCATPCSNCPYSPAYTGELRGPENWNARVQELIRGVSIENSPNSHFSELPNAKEIVDKIRKGCASRTEVYSYWVNH